MRVVNIRLRRVMRILIGAIPIVILLIVYAIASAARVEANSNDKVPPTFAAMTEAKAAVSAPESLAISAITAFDAASPSVMSP